MKCSVLVTGSVLHENQQCPVQSASGSDRMISLAGSSSGLNSGAYFSLTAANVSSSSVGTADNEVGEYDCESEEGLVEEAPTKPVPSGSSSKRGGAAEVRNLSEKRRRSRINEKMKALQNLIPNSNKTDKASMLDEAIEYLKQLQLPVQMLTMRNGLSLYPMCASGAANRCQFSQRKMDFYECQASLKVMDLATLPNALSMPDHYTIPKQTSVSNNLSAIDSVTSFGWESSRVGSFELPRCSKGIHAEETLSCVYSSVNLTDKSCEGYHIGAEATEEKEITLQASLLARYRSDNVSLKDLEREAFTLPQMDGMSVGRSARIKTESGYF